MRRKQCQIERILRNGKVYFSFFVAPSTACVKNYFFGNDVHNEVCIQKESKLRFFQFSAYSSKVIYTSRYDSVRFRIPFSFSN